MQLRELPTPDLYQLHHCDTVRLNEGPRLHDALPLPAVRYSSPSTYPIRLNIFYYSKSHAPKDLFQGCILNFRIKTSTPLTEGKGER